MKVLLIEDSLSKAADIENILVEFGSDPTIVRSSTLSDAVRMATSDKFELIVLDLMIPYIQGVHPDSEAGYEFMRQIRSGTVNKYTKVVAISAFPDEVGNYRNRFAEMAVIVASYDGGGLWKSLLKEILAEILASDQWAGNLEFLIVCALDEERDGFVDTDIKWLSDHSVRGLNVRMASLDGAMGAVMRTSQMGLVTATYEVGLALRLFDPKIIAMSGICAGMSGKTKLGQLVSASLAWEYQAGKWSSEGFEIAPLQIPIPSSTRTALDHLFDEFEFAEKIDRELSGIGPRPSTLAKPIIAPVASGSAVIAEAERLKHIIVQHRKVAAIDMETFGVFYAAHEGRGRLKDFFSIKTVVDMADESKNDDIHRYGCHASARATILAIRRLIMIHK